MKVRAQRTHFMGFSNRNRETLSRTGGADVFEKSFNKSKSQYYQTTGKFNAKDQNNTLSKTNKNTYVSQLNFNSLYKDSQKGHHFELQNNQLTNQQKDIQHLHKELIQTVPLPRNMNFKLNQGIRKIKKEFQNQDINLHKLKQLKSTFLRNNQKRSNLKEYFKKYASSDGLIQKSGFERLIKDYGYHINEREIDLMFKLNEVHEGNTNSLISLDQSKHKSKVALNLGQFVSLMTKENVFFNTLKLPNRSKDKGYRFSPAHFQIFRNKFNKLKEAFYVYKGDKINAALFQKVMKKLDINDLVIKENQRLQIFKEFSNQKGQLNVEQIITAIARQEHERVSQSGNQLKVTNHDGFQQNISANQQFKYDLNSKKDPLNDLLYPLNLKKTSYVEYQRHLKSARQICTKIKEIKQKSNPNILNNICQADQPINKKQVYKKLQTILQNQGYNFTKHQYKSFLSYLDFDLQNNISKQNLQKFVLKESENERVDRLDRRKRNPQALNKNSEKLNEQNSIERFHQKDDDFVDRMRSKSSLNWTSVKRSIIKQSNITEFHVPTKFSAWPERLYNPDFSLIQARNTSAIGINQENRFNKQEKHSYGQQDKLRRQRVYQNKVKKNAQWQEWNHVKLHDQSGVQQQKNLAKQYNMRLLKEQYENRCHSKSEIK